MQYMARPVVCAMCKEIRGPAIAARRTFPPCATALTPGSLPLPAEPGPAQLDDEEEAAGAGGGGEGVGEAKGQGAAGGPAAPRPPALQCTPASVFHPKCLFERQVLGCDAHKPLLVGPYYCVATLGCKNVFLSHRAPGAGPQRLGGGR